MRVPVRCQLELSDVCQAIGARQLEIRHHDYSSVIAQTAIRDLVRLGSRLKELLELYPPIEERA